MPRSIGSVSGPSAPDASRLGGKQLQFLATKVVPPRYQGLIERPRLLGMTSQLSTKRLAVIKAPAGFGKTSLAVAWTQELQRTGNVVAWLTIDRADDEPTTFVFYLCHALRTASKRLGTAALDLIHESFLFNPRAVISALINDLADLDDEIYFFLEDYHWIGNSKIHESLAFFLKHAPSHCHVILTTRTEPDLPLASLRAQNQLLEIDASALRFDLQEARDFIELELAETLAPADVRLLVEKTEGWACRPADTGVHLRADTRGFRRISAQTLRHSPPDRRISRGTARRSSARLVSVHASDRDPRTVLRAAV
jgi:LuxR family transcriptional regulator, maltose regulon positive regulatory protein